jgi:ubiquinone/menaquinone biosynthesis C-methylase UbiE
MSGKAYIGELRLIGLLTEPALRQAIRGLKVAPGTRGLDVGCGYGEKTLWFADEIGPAGSVAGVDTSRDHLKAATNAAAEAGLSGRVQFRRGNLHHLPFGDASFDWAWSSDVLWPGPGIEPIKGVKEMRRVVKPGGFVSVMFWFNQTLLPGYPLLEAELNLAHAKANPYLADVPPRLQFMRALGWLREAGLDDLSATAYTVHHQAPFSDEKRRALIYCFQMFWENVSTLVSKKDWSLFQELSGLGPGECILDSPDYVCAITYMLYRGRVPGSSATK